MKNSQIGTIDLQSADLPRSRFDWKSTLHSTLQFGEVVPGYVQYMDAGDKLHVRSSERLLAAPLLAPVFGKATLKGVHQFVPISDLTDNHAPMMAQQQVARGDSVITPSADVSIPLKDLSIFALWGAKVTLYDAGYSAGLTTSGDGDYNISTLFEYNGSDGTLSSGDPGYASLTASGLTTFAFSNYGLTNAASDSVGRFLDDWTNRNSYRHIPFSNHSMGSYLNVLTSSTYYQSFSEMVDLDTVSIDAADVIIPSYFELSGNKYLFYYAFRLSSFGKRIKKLLNVAGYELNFSTSLQVNVLPLIAVYKAYFDVYAPQLYQNWEQTYAYRFMRLCDLSSSITMPDFWKGSYGSLPDDVQLFQDFMIKEVGATFYTSEQDFVSSHTRKTGVSSSPVAAGAISKLVDVDSGNYYVPNVASINSQNEPTDLLTPNGQSYITSTIHGQLDSELLKRLYRWTNRNTIAGRRIAELLRAQGLGAYVDACKPSFIGAFEVPLNVYDMLSAADTFNKAADSGAPLGERAGNGQAESQERPFEFECSEPGYWITLITVVPEGGYTETLSPAVLARTKFDYHSADFDSVGEEFDPKALVQASQPCADFTASSGRVDDSLGLAPRYFRWKFPRNVQTGDFTLRSARASVAPYSLEKYIDVGNRMALLRSGSSTRQLWQINKMFKPVDLPIAGNVWRYPTRYPFIGHFNRIFNYSTGTYERWYRNPSTQQAEYEFFGWMADNFILHIFFDAVNYSKKLPVSKSFETDDEGKTNSSMGKA